MQDQDDSQVVYLANRFGGQYWVVRHGEIWHGPFTLRQHAVATAQRLRGMPRHFM